LQLAVRLGSPFVLATLLAYGADAEAKDHFGLTVFGIAVASGNTACVEAMLNPLQPPPRIWTVAAKEYLDGQRSKAGNSRMNRKGGKSSTTATTQTGDQVTTSSSNRLRRKSSIVAKSQTEELHATPDSGEGSSPVRRVTPVVEAASAVEAEGADRVEPGRPEASQEMRTESDHSSSSTFECSEATDDDDGGDDDDDAPEEPKLSHGRFGLVVQAGRMRDALLSDELPAPIYAGFAIAEVDNVGRGMVTLASIARRPELVRLLFAAKASVAEKDNNGSTPLMYAASAGDEATVEVLLAEGAEASERNFAQQCAADMTGSARVRAMLHRNMVENKIPRPRGGPPPVPEIDHDTAPPTTLRIENLPVLVDGEAVEKLLRSVFQRCGAAEPLRVNVAVDPISRRLQGYAHVDFAELEDAKKTFLAHGQTIGGSILRIFHVA